jgi:hypothetical protein
LPGREGTLLSLTNPGRFSISARNRVAVTSVVSSLGVGR